MEPYIGEIKLFAFGFIPKGWVPCDGQLMAIQQNSALFSLLGTQYGGDGVRTFAIPDMRGRVPAHFNTAFPQGAKGGTGTTALTIDNMPAHTHNVAITSADQDSSGVANNLICKSDTIYAAPPATAPEKVQVNMAATIGSTGGAKVSNMMPATGLTFCVAVSGIFPSRN